MRLSRFFAVAFLLALFTGDGVAGEFSSSSGDLARDSNGNAVVSGAISVTCVTYAYSTVSVGTAAVPVPASALPGRKLVRVCNSLLNLGSPKVRCLAGADPGLLSDKTLPGEILGVGDCLPYQLADTVPLKCISDAAGTAVTVFQCS